VSDIFVSHASPDRGAAFRIVGFLEQNGISFVDDSTLKLTRADGEAQDGPIRVRCPAK
jgi:hypothetical protein